MVGFGTESHTGVLQVKLRWLYTADQLRSEHSFAVSPSLLAPGTSTSESAGTPSRLLFSADVVDWQSTTSFAARVDVHDVPAGNVSGGEVKSGNIYMTVIIMIYVPRL